MKVIRMEELRGTEREVKCPRGGFTSLRALLASDGMGFTMTKTVIPVAGPQRWHYTKHLEACYCVSGKALLVECATGAYHAIAPDTLYVLNNHDEHMFDAIEETTLICVFNPPLTGREVHRADGSYACSFESGVVRDIW
jgi:L-ectoine synthase